MIQGWQNDNYLILFQEQIEASEMAERYCIASYLPGYTLVGLRSWDDFILCDTSLRLFTVPTVPLAAQYLQSFSFDQDPAKIQADQRFTDKIKWHIKPIVFGGDAKADSNIVWLTLDQHVEAVKWWNKTYLDLKQKKQT